MEGNKEKNIFTLTKNGEETSKQNIATRKRAQSRYLSIT